MELNVTIKELIRLNIKPNFKALGAEYDCDWRTTKKKYYEELNKEKGIEIIRKERIHIIDEFKKLIINKLETEILEIFKKLAHEDGKCVIIVTHSPNVCEMVDQVYDLKKVK